eukprot:TRINITY_DN27198_c0_g1_i1.p1 TRINITY_DN27198_c0_g1~~TRINITY_DN27198_c0_g1_i1.p1  ORF type:complete len:321 (-),score=49.71 TRINITY_DN27198_c0_g1_i1:18-980(-)
MCIRDSLCAVLFFAIPLAVCATPPHLLRDLTSPTSRAGFAAGPIVSSNSSALLISGQVTQPGRVKCFLTPVSSFNQSDLAPPRVAAAQFWSENASFPSVTLVATVDATGSFILELEADYGSLFLSLCGFDGKDPPTAPVRALPALAIVGKPASRCSRALLARSDPVLRLSSPDLHYPWDKMKMYSASGVGGVDAGQHDSCLVQQNTTFCNMYFAGAFTSGLCLPDACTADTVAQDYNFTLKSEISMYASALIEIETVLEEQPGVGNFTKGLLVAALAEIGPKLTESVEALVIASISKWICLLYTSPSPRDRTRSRMPSSA